MKNKFLTRKEKIIISTVDVINEIGIKELSMKEIAKRENITDAALYKHFESKEQLILEVLEYYSKYDVYIINTLKNNGQNEKENIVMFFKLYSEYYESYPALTSIIGIYDVLLYDENLGVKIIEIFNQRTEFMKSLIEKGQKNENIKENIKPDNLTDILLGTFERIIFTWRLNNFSFSLNKKTIELINQILNIC